MVILSSKETYVSIDIETDGNLPGVNSMLSLGAVAFDSEGNELDTWYNKFLPLESARPDPDTLKWWEKFPAAWEECHVNPSLPGTAIDSLNGWLNGLPGKAVLMANPAAWDGMFTNWYAVQFSYFQKYLVTKHRVLDIRSFTMGALGGGFLTSGRDDLRKRFKAITAANPMQHHALHDAREQGQQFFEVVRLVRGREDRLIEQDAVDLEERARRMLG